MYTINADGQLLFDSLSEDVKSIALSPKLSLDVNKAGSLSFVLPPGNRMHSNLKKLKSILTVEQDGEQLARLRVMETQGDFYNQKNVYCEGDKAFLLDSLHAPYSYSGTVQGLFRKLIDNHNANVDSEKQFTVGNITAVSSSETTEVENDAYASTSSEIENRLLNAYGGYLRTRTANGVHYIDWIKQYGNENAQPIEFAVNLLDLTDKVDASDVFTVLIPLGASGLDDEGEYTEPVSIASVNNGLNYIQDDEGIAKHGKIWRTYTWSEEEDPAKLLEKAREYLKTGIALETLTLKAVDMHFTNGNVQPIRIGDKVRILSNPHGLDKVMTCSQIEIDLLNPENTLYTFGEKPRTLTENFVRAEEEVEVLTGRGGGGGVKKEIGEIKRWAQLTVNPQLGLIDAIAWDIEDLTGRTSEVEVYMNAVEALIKLKAERNIFNEFDDRVSNAEIILNGAEGSIGLVASVEEYGRTLEDTRQRMVKAGIDINADLESVKMFVEKDGVITAINTAPGNVTIDADKIDLNGYVTASKFETKMATIDNIFAGRAKADNLYVEYAVGAQSGQFTNISLINYDCNWKTLKMGDLTFKDYLGKKVEDAMDLNHSHAVTVDETTGLVTLGEVSETGGNFNIADTTFHKTAVSASYDKGKTDWSPVSVERTDYSTSRKSVTVRAVNAAGVPLIGLEEIDASEIYNAGETAGYKDGKTDWNPVDLVRVSYSTSQKEITVRAVNAAGVPVIADDLDASEIYEAGAESVTDEIVIGSDAPTSITHLGDNVYQMKVRIWAKYNGETIASATISPTKGVY